MTGGSQLGTDLVGAAGDQVAFQQGQPPSAGQRPIFGHRRPGTGHGTGLDKDLLLGLVLPQIPLQRAIRRLDLPHDGTQVQLDQLPIPNLLVHHPQRLGGLGSDDDAAGVPVDAVAQRRREGVLPEGVPLLLLVQVRLDVVDEGVHVLRLIPVYHHARGLVHQQDVFVFI